MNSPLLCVTQRETSCTPVYICTQPQLVVGSQVRPSAAGSSPLLFSSVSILSVVGLLWPYPLWITG